MAFVKRGAPQKVDPKVATTRKSDDGRKVEASFHDTAGQEEKEARKVGERR